MSTILFTLLSPIMGTNAATYWAQLLVVNPI